MDEFTKYCLKVEYDGTFFCGWQRQASERTVQEELEKAAGQLFPETPAIHGASRTDSGVHAIGQVAHFRVRKKRPTERVTSAFNDYLPEDVSVLNTRVADPDFQSHIDATGKTYVYLIMNRREPPALLRNHLYWHPGSLETEPMREAILKFQGTHNFLGFATNADDEEDPVCRIVNTELKQIDSCYLFSITGDRFLYNMVRCMVGTLVSIGKGKSSPDVVDDLFHSQNRGDAGAVMAGKGLYLYEVYYEALDELEVSLDGKLQNLLNGFRDS